MPFFRLCLNYIRIVLIKNVVILISCADVVSQDFNFLRSPLRRVLMPKDSDVQPRTRADLAWLLYHARMQLRYSEAMADKKARLKNVQLSNPFEGAEFPVHEIDHFDFDVEYKLMLPPRQPAASNVPPRRSQRLESSTSRVLIYDLDVESESGRVPCRLNPDSLKQCKMAE